jgi:hypothetical protein
LVERTDGKQSAIAGELAWRRLDHERRAEEVWALQPGGSYAQVQFPGEGKRPAVSEG